MNTDPLWFKMPAGVHVSAGMLSFVIAPMALAMEKGGRPHERWGCAAVGVPAVILTTIYYKRKFAISATSSGSPIASTPPLMG
jgi:hypothetical protein